MVFNLEFPSWLIVLDISTRVLTITDKHKDKNADSRAVFAFSVFVWTLVLNLTTL